LAGTAVFPSVSQAPSAATAAAATAEFFRNTRLDVGIVWFEFGVLRVNLRVAKSRLSREMEGLPWGCFYLVVREYLTLPDKP
jgi:hypothetical protein